MYGYNSAHRIDSARPRRHHIKKALTKKITIAKWELNAFGVVCVSAGVIIGAYGVLSGVIPGIWAASDITESWTLDTSGDYILSDAASIEVSGGEARLKVREYQPDGDTVALYHMNESGGSILADSSIHGNTGTVVDSTFGQGNLHNAVSLNGFASSITVNHSSSLALTQKNSIEAWTKLNSNFSAGSSAQRFGIVDKGDYMLYYDNETGKVTYELADKNASSWTQTAGNDLNDSWDTNGKRSVNTTVKMGSNLYVGIGADLGDAEVWQWDGSIWVLIGGGPKSVNSSWNAATYEGVYSLATDGASIYAGLGTGTGEGEVWRWNGTVWTKIGGDSLNSGWTNYVEGVYSLDYFGGNLYAGLGSGAGDAEVWRWNGTVWTKIGGDSLNSGWATTYEFVANLTNDGSQLFAALGLTAGDSEVWSWNGTVWTKIGGDSLNSGWDNTIETVRTLKYFGGSLYAGLGDSANDAEVWQWNGTAWTKIGGDSLNSGWGANYEYVTALAWDGTNLFAGLGASDGDGEVWQWNGTAWTKIGGDGIHSGWAASQGDVVNILLYDSGTLYAGNYDTAGDGFMWSHESSTWTLIGGGYVNKSWGNYGMGAVNVMQKVGDYLYAGLGNTAGSAVVWRFDGTAWQMIGGQGINGSWSAMTYEQVMSIASFQGNLMVGLGTSANDAEVWQWNGTAWTKIGGDSLNSGWGANYEEVNAMAATESNLYVGLGSSANDGEVWQWNGTAWTKIGGDSLNSGWTNYGERVLSMGFYNDKLYAGLGYSLGDAEVWEWSGSTWSKVGGDGVGGSWGASAYYDVSSLMPYNGKLYAGLGYAAGNGSLWEWDGSTWTQVGGDDINGSWASGTYERVRTLAVYNGDLYAGLGNTAGEGEVWRLSVGTWSKVGGPGINGGWGAGVEEIESFSAYKGKFYAGTGLSANADAAIWSWGNNAFLQSDATNFDTDWHHVAATYDGAMMKLFIDGVEDASISSNVLLPTIGRNLLIGRTYGGREYGKQVGVFNGQIDELRISKEARNSFNLTPYSVTAQTVQPTTAVRTSGVLSWDSFTDSSTSDGGSINYRLSDDAGSTWQYWDGVAWSQSTSLVEVNSPATILANISSFVPGSQGFLWQAILYGNGNQRPSISSVTMEATSDTTSPTNPDTLEAKHQAGGTSITSGTWYNHAQPSFSWSGAADAGSGLDGYYVYFGTDNTADPVTAGQLQDQATYTASALNSGSIYYLRIKSRDAANNAASTVWSPFSYHYDSTPPINPGVVSASPSGYTNVNNFTFVWPITGGATATDTASGIAGYQYKTGISGGPLSNWSSIVTDGSITINEAAYQEGTNTFYLRAIDNAGNIASSAVQTNFYYAGNAPTPPTNLQVSPTTNTQNSFAFNWDRPNTFSGDANKISYCYTINTLPSASTCTFTGFSVTALAPDAFATQPGDNTFYVVARDETNNIAYGSYTQVTFTSQTTAPGVPQNQDISDVSVKNTQSWKIALAWEAPLSGAESVANYQIYHSSDDVSYTKKASTSGIAFVDTGLTQQMHYYKVRACDSTNNCGAFTPTISLKPDGKFTEPATLVSEPVVDPVTTKQALIKWTTDRTSDSKISYGIKPGQYYPEEPSTPNQVTAHSVNLSNLSPGTTYYYKVKWTDEDGNTGSSNEFQFTTAPAPSIADPKVKSAGLDNVAIQYTAKGASSVKIAYGLSQAFAGLKETPTSTSEASYVTVLDGLQDGATYYYRLSAVDAEGDEYPGNILTFTTVARPKIGNVAIQQLPDSAQPSVQVTWTTNTETSSIITYYPSSQPSEFRDEVIVALVKGEHKLTVKSLLPQTAYTLVVKGRDRYGNEAESDPQRFTTSTDSRPAKISNVKVEGSKAQGASKQTQLVVTWTTDEPTTSQVEFGSGSGSSYSQKTQEDSNLTTNHLVVIPNLTPSEVYHLRVISKDAANNESKSADMGTITPKAPDDAFSLVLANLSEVFSFLNILQ